ncbi:hypothetical protein UFOVP1025_15 [uncultured Caudovirales phage]|uniref:Uncharacterized protein n=1 Tax=uncultured Caudovirales phage TaxID=2100421 RepID=A0A6J5SWJ9_9CAUD|nr:hypothetical protein UFOVP852_19 [uncultured Caudovirales phage]CAB4173268.1 hypothetical protein UFOVP948_42 [uncultured Caudovirales phage]CAB4178920.1 hypothetical protein UFOVP1025_15 [uncultured Caudovirales phage]CAB4219878.1 hypothetical protein UFOVP1628_18 [uncultured Caudovirales phage]
MSLFEYMHFLLHCDTHTPDLIPVDKWRPDDARRYDDQRKDCIQYLRDRNMYILDGKFTPTKAANTDITVTFNRARSHMGETLIQVAK